MRIQNYITSLTEQVKSDDNSTTLTKIFHSIRPIYYFCKIVGLAPMNFKKTRLEPEWADWLYFAFFLLLYSVISFYTYIKATEDNSNYQVVSKSIVIIECCLITVLMYSVFIFAFLQRKSLMKSFNLLAHIDDIFIKHAYSIDYKLLLKNNYILLGLVSVSAVVRIILLLTTISLDFVQQLTLYANVLVKTLATNQFVAYVLQLQIRYVKINNIIKSFYKNRYNAMVLEPTATTTNNIISDKLYILCRLHYKLANVMRILNKVFAVQQLLSVGVSLFNILFHSYYLYYIFSGRATHFTVTMIACPLFWLLDEVMEVYLLVYACATTSDNANETPIILHELRNKSFDIKLESHIQMYSLQMLHQRIQFTALGFFVIDYTLIYSIVGAVTTYLVIFIQFDQTHTSLMESTEEPLTGIYTNSTLMNVV